ncbi:MAG: class I SAM-dependent methyltransferase [Erysipelotrichaceae bacterium]
MKELNRVLSELINEQLIKLVVSNKRKKTQELQKVVVRPISIKGSYLYQVERFSVTQAFHQNVDAEALLEILLTLVQDFKQMDVTCEQEQVVIKCNKVDKCHVSRKAMKTAKPIQFSHNRKKQYLLTEGMQIPAFVDLGIFSEDGKIHTSHYDKFKQINRFVEMIEDALDDSITHLNIIDFGCGKSYLTFILYYYLTEVKNISVEMIGLDLKKDVIENCDEIAKKYGYEHLHFALGDIAGYQAPFAVDMVISLHACDTATDHALFNAIRWNAKMIFSVPCCQHEFNATYESKSQPLYHKYGLIKERMAALTTDALRGALLEDEGYRVQMLEFIELAHSPKNILIRAIQDSKQAKAANTQAVEALLEDLQVSSTLYQLLKGEKKA